MELLHQSNVWYKIAFTVVAVLCYGFAAAICFILYLLFTVALWVDWIEWNWVGYCFLACAIAIPIYAVYDIHEAWNER